GTPRMCSGRYVSAGDRFETIRPGYQVVYDQPAAALYAHETLSSQLSPDHGTLPLVTRPRTAAVNYAVTIPAVAANGSSPQAAGPQAAGPMLARRSAERRHGEIDR